MSIHYQTQAIAVGPVVEAVSDRHADICTCSAKHLRQAKLRDATGNHEVAKRIALMWNACLDAKLSNDEIASGIIAEAVSFYKEWLNAVNASKA